MRRVLLCMMLASTFTADAQKFNVTTASIAVTRYQDPSSNAEDKQAALREGKEAIDKAATNAESMADPKMWYNRGVIYMIIATDINTGITDPNAAETAMEAFIKCIQTDNDKKKFSQPSRDNLGQGVAWGIAYKAIEAYNAKNYDRALHYYKKLIEIGPYDTGKLMESKNNIFIKEIYYTMGVAATNAGKKKEAAEYFQASIEKGYNSPNAYIGLAGTLMEQGDTAKALEWVEKGRDNYPGSSELIRQEINIYISRQRIDILIKKLDLAIESNPNNELFFYIRGNSYQIMADNEEKKVRMLEDTITLFQKQLRLTSDPKKKSSIQSRINETKARISKSKADKDLYLDHCEQDYKKALELKEDMMDVHYGLGAYYLNIAGAFTDQMNNLPLSAEKEYAAAKDKQDAFYKKSIVHFERALALIKNEPETELGLLKTLYEVYSRVGNMEKSLEYKKKSTEFEAKKK